MVIRYSNSHYLLKQKGIPDFWLTILKSSPPIDQTIEDHDEPILEALKDIRCKLAEDPNQMAFTLGKFLWY